MTSTSKLGDEFLRIPKLDVSGSNWVLYKERFFWALDARAILEHVDGTGTEPMDPVPKASRDAKALSAAEKELDPSKEVKDLSAAEKELEKEWKKELKEWKQNEAVAKQQIASSIPDSLFMKIRTKGSAYEIWKELENHFQNRSRMVSVDLRRRIQDLRCAEKGDMLSHFATLRTMREDLASMGQPLSENDFYAIILGSLPASYDPYVSAVNATSSVLGKTISADDLMLTVTEEYERRVLKGKTGKKDENAAFYSNDSEKGGKGGSNSNSRKKNVECHNCHKKGHYKSDCWAPGGGKEGQRPNQKGKGKGKQDEKKKEAGTSAEAKGKEKEKEKDTKESVDEAWLAMVDDAYEGELEEDTLMDFASLDDSINDYPDFDELEEPTFNSVESTQIPVTPFDTISDSDDPDDGAYTTSFSTDQLAGSAEARNVEVDLYDSGASRHMSGFRHKFIDLVDIEPVPISAADKRTFKATGRGKMIIHLPNGDHGPSRAVLMNALYAPSMGVTLVSISLIAKAGCTVVFSGEFCRIYKANKERMGEIKERQGLYRVYMSSSQEGANVAGTKEALTIYELHRRLGHVSHDRVKLLMSKGLVEGVTLDQESEASVCESCEWAKGVRKAVVKVREGERCVAVGDEIHSDLWGPAPVETIGKKRYYISFTDDYTRYTNVYFLQTKDEAFSYYHIYEAWLSTQHDAQIKCLNSDRGGRVSVEGFLRSSQKGRNNQTTHCSRHSGAQWYC